MDGLKASSGRSEKPKKITKAKKQPMQKKKGALSNILSVVVTAVLVGGAIYAWQDKVNDDSLAEVEKNARNVREGYERSIKNLENEKRKTTQKLEELENKNNQLKNQVELAADAVKKHENEELALSFSYPALMGDVDYQKSAGAEGDRFFGEFSNNENFYFSGASQSYRPEQASSTQDISFKNFVRIEEDGDEYIAYFTSSDDNIGYKLNPAEIINFSGGQAFLVDKNSFQYEEGQPKVAIGQNVGAILNTGQDIFPGVAFLNSDFGKLSLEEFKKLLREMEINND